MTEPNSTEPDLIEAEQPTARREPRPVRFRHLVGACIVTALLAGTTGAYANHFPDVPNSHPFHSQIAWLTGTGITDGFPDGTYRPEANVTRAQMAAFLQRAYNLQAGLKAVDTGSGGSAGGTSGTIDTWVTVPGASATVTIPAGTTGRIVGTFTSEAACNFGDNVFLLFLAVRPTCMARILINGAAATPNGFAVDNSGDAAVEPDVIIDNRSFSIQAASAANRPAANYTVTVQIMANDTDANVDDKLLIDLQDWILTAEAVLNKAPT